MPDALVLSHPEQLDRLADAVPQAAPHAVLAGDPCYDRLIASLPLRDRFRAALGVPDGGKLVVVSSTWHGKSLFGVWPQLLRRLIAELPVDEYRVAAILHPNAWFEHSPWQIRMWLADCLRAGLRLVHPLEGWGAALVAADHLVGDHGAVTTYAAALGVPVVLGTFPEEEVAEHSPVALLGKLAPRLDHSRALLPQLGQRSDLSPVAELVTSAPGESAALVRAQCYRMMGLSEPDTSPPVYELPIRLHSAGEPQALYVTGEITGPDSVRLTRFAADVRRGAPLPDAHLVVHDRHPNRALNSNADIVLGGTLGGRPGCSLAVVDDVIHTESAAYRVTGDPALAASALFLWPSRPPRLLTIHIGNRVVETTFSPVLV